MKSHVQRFLVIVVKIDERDKRDEQAINELTIEDVFNLTSSFEKAQIIYKRNSWIFGCLVN